MSGCETKAYPSVTCPSCTCTMLEDEQTLVVKCPRLGCELYNVEFPYIELVPTGQVIDFAIEKSSEAEQ